MTTCFYCGDQEIMPFTCKFCGERFCREHRLPENHGCIGLQKFKEERGKEPEKWIYEPFQEKYKREAGRRVPKSIAEKILYALKNLNTKTILYIILLIILIVLVWEVIR